MWVLEAVGMLETEGVAFNMTASKRRNRGAKDAHSREEGRLAWRCPTCNSPDHTPIVLRTETTLNCRNCSEGYVCVNGEVTWRGCSIEIPADSTDPFEWVDWTVRLLQADDSLVEVGFRLHNPDFKISGGDFLVVLTKRTRGGRGKVMCVENKTSGYLINPRN